MRRTQHAAPMRTRPCARMQGPYQKAATMRRLTEMVVTQACLVHESDASLMDSLGLYFDNPAHTLPEECRSVVAYCANTNGSSGEAPALMTGCVVRSDHRGSDWGWCVRVRV
jgi:hypothetical protein